MLGRGVSVYVCGFDFYVLFFVCFARFYSLNLEIVALRQAFKIIYIQVMYFYGKIILYL